MRKDGGGRTERAWPTAVAIQGVNASLHLPPISATALLPAQGSEWYKRHQICINLHAYTYLKAVITGLAMNSELSINCTQIHIDVWTLEQIKNQRAAYWGTQIINPLIILQTRLNQNDITQAKSRSNSRSIWYSGDTTFVWVGSLHLPFISNMLMIPCSLWKLTLLNSHGWRTFWTVSPLTQD